MCGFLERNRDEEIRDWKKERKKKKKQKKKRTAFSFSYKRKLCADIEEGGRQKKTQKVK